MNGKASKGGRPRGFDREEAVETAMRLFWRHGYEGVSLAMLTTGIGVAPPSLYAAFGSKAGLYREALDRYAASTSLALSSDEGLQPTLAEALERMFDHAIASAAGHSREKGCMISTGFLGCHPDHQGLADELAARRSALNARLAEELRRWLPVERCGEVATFLCAMLQGIAVQARDGADIATLRTIAKTARSCIPYSEAIGATIR